MPLVHAQMARGRTLEQKQAFLRAISDAAVETLGAPRESVRVWITEFESTEYLAGDEILADKKARLAKG